MREPPCRPHVPLTCASSASTRTFVLAPALEVVIIVLLLLPLAVVVLVFVVLVVDLASDLLVLLAVAAALLRGAVQRVQLPRSLQPWPPSLRVALKLSDTPSAQPPQTLHVSNAFLPSSPPLALLQKKQKKQQ